MTNVSYVDFQQKRGVAWDIIDEAITAFDDWMLDDDYDADSKLKSIIERMRERRAMYQQSEGPTP